jgi:hypothetical protein
VLFGLQPTAELSAWPDHRPGRDELLQPVAESVSPPNPEESQQVGEQEGVAPGDKVIKLFVQIFEKLGFKLNRHIQVQFITDLLPTNVTLD